MLAFCLRYNQRNFPSICARIDSALRRVLLCLVDHDIRLDRDDCVGDAFALAEMYKSQSHEERKWRCARGIPH
jgi:hypothetical protein